MKISSWNKDKKISVLFFLITSQCLFMQYALAACNNLTPGSNASVTCSGSNPNTAVNAVLGSSNVDITVQSGASLTGAHPSGMPFTILSVDTNSNIDNHGTLEITGGTGTGTNRGAAMLGSKDGNTLHNHQDGTINTNGAYNDGMAANGSNNKLINEGSITTGSPNSYGMSAAWGQAVAGANNNELINKGTINTTGSSARGMSILGGFGVITNEGAITTTGNNSTGIYLQGDKGSIVNSGRIEASDEGIYSNTVASSFTSYIENKAGGEIISQTAEAIRTLNGNTTVINAGTLTGVTHSIRMGNGNDTVILQTGSVINGIADGGAGNNSVFLQGMGEVTNDFVNYKTLTMQGDMWKWTNTNSAFDQVTLSSGEFQLMGTLTGTQANIQGGVLLSGTGTFIGNVVNQGTIQPGLGQATGALTIKGGYTGSSGALNINTVLGNDSSPSSRLVLDGGIANGVTSIKVNNIGGAGALTNNGILIVGTINGATTDAGAFNLSNRVVAGVYEYTLRQGTVADPTDNSWYLNSTALKTSLNKAVTLYRPETGSYLNNQSAGALMFMHTLHDRVIEKQYNEAYRNKDSNIWLRMVQRKTNSTAMSKQVDVDSDLTLMHFGADLWQQNYTDKDQLVLGLMGAYGHSSSDAKAKITGYGAKAKTEGYSAGIYSTWYENTETQLGFYTDSWLQHAWYKNKVDGETLKQEKYDSRGWTVSAEMGYGFEVANNNKGQVVIEPQAQIAYNDYKVKNHTEANGTRVTNSDASGVIARLGTRIYHRNNESSLQPFVELNWWYSSAKNTLDFNDQKVSDDIPHNRYEAKIGVQGNINKDWQVWGHIGAQAGQNKYSSYEGRFGIKKHF